MPGGPPPPANLKERIAALQQRNVTPPTHKPTGSPPTVPPAGAGAGAGAGNANALRDKIARFEKKGGVPVPRGSFGMGAPPTQLEGNKSKELYGNRIPGYARSTSGTSALSQTSSRSSSPMLPDESRVASPSPDSASPVLASTKHDTPITPLVSPISNTLSLPQSPQFSSDATTSPASLPNEAVGRTSHQDRITDKISPDMTASLLNKASIDRSASFESSNKDVSLSNAKGISGFSVSTVSSPDHPILESEKTPTTSTFNVKLSPAQDSITSPFEGADALPVASVPITSQLEMSDREVSSSSIKPQVVNETSFSGLEAETSVGDLDLTSSSINIHFKPVDVRVASRVIQPTSRATTVVVSPKLDDHANSAAMVSTTKSISYPPHRISPHDIRGSASNATISEIATSEERQASSESLSTTRHSDIESSGVESNSSAAGSKTRETKSSFKAVVHRKVSEPQPATLPQIKTGSAIPSLSETSQPSGIQRTAAGSSQAPSTPGYGDLEMLLENAALLELHLQEGSDFTETAPAEPSVDPIPSKRSPSPNSDAPESSYEEISVGVAPSTVEPKIITPGPRSTSLLQSDSSLTSTPDVPIQSNTKTVTPKAVPTIVTPEQLNYLEPSSEIQATSQGETVTNIPSKPSVPRYFSTFRKKTDGRPVSAYEASAHHRQSISTTSETSYDDCLVTPGDDSYESSLHPTDAMSVKSGRAWSLARKKSGMGIGRAASFAGKLLQRKRTKSGASTSDDASIASDVPSMPSRGPSLDPYSSTQTQNSLIPSPSDPTTDSLADGFHRPSSWLSQDSSSTFLPSPNSTGIFDESIFDAFPSVPQNLPAISEFSLSQTNGRPHTISYGGSRT